MRYNVSLVATVMMILCASGVRAQCAFDAPAKAKGFKSAMVRAYSACPGVTFAAPNTATMAGVPACGPSVAMSTYQFGVNGACKLRLSQKAERPCSNGCGPECATITIKADCKDVLDAAGLPINDGPWSLNLVMRATVDDALTGDMTIADSPAQFAFRAPRRGKLKLRVSTNDLSPFGCIFLDSSIPACTSTELLSVAIVDPDGTSFATIGSSTR